MSQSHWLPLESNPDVINAYLRKLGIGGKWNCVGVIGFDDDSLALLPKPVAALLLLFPITDEYEKFAKEEAAKGDQKPAPDGDVYFIKQSIGNACGTIAIIHALANNEKRIDLGNGPFKKFLDSSKSANPDELATLLEKDEDMMKCHESSAEEGQTRAPPRDAKVDLHFVAFVNVNGTLYELDGRKLAPIAHGKTTDDTLLKDAVDVCKKFIDREPENLNFTALAIYKEPDDAESSGTDTTPKPTYEELAIQLETSTAENKRLKTELLAYKAAKPNTSDANAQTSPATSASTSAATSADSLLVNRGPTGVGDANSDGDANSNGDANGGGHANGGGAAGSRH